MTSTEKLIAAHCDKKVVFPGDNLFVKPDFAIGDELSINGLLNHLDEFNDKSFENISHIALINGHITSLREAADNSHVHTLEKFAIKHQISNYFQIGKSGECGCLLAENGLIMPGNFAISTDRHIIGYGAVGALATGVSAAEMADTWINGSVRISVPESAKIVLSGSFQPLVTPKDLALHLLAMLGKKGAKGLSLEISGDAVTQLDISARFTLANLLVESGARFVHLPIDEQVLKFLKVERADLAFSQYLPDSDAEYKWTREINLDEIVPMVATPGSPVNGVPARDVGYVKVNQVIIGSCTNGNIEDFRQVRQLVGSRKISKDVRFHLFPASHKTIREMLSDDLGLMLTALGSKMSPPSCQACLGIGPNLLGPREIGVYTTNQNRNGQHGSPSSRVYLAGPLVAAATAITGQITDPRDL